MNLDRFGAGARPRLGGVRKKFVCCLVAWLVCVPLAAVDCRDQEKPQADQPARALPVPINPPPCSWYAPTSISSTRRSPETPSYVRQFERPGWLDLGLEQRSRFESLENTYLFDGVDSSHFPLRTRFFFGIRNILDPFRFAVELQDSTQLGGQIPENPSTDNRLDFLQFFGELHLSNFAGLNRPLRLRVGRLSFDSVDRRLVSRSGYRNTTNNFDGVRLKIGEPVDDWELEFFSLWPVIREVESPDTPDRSRNLLGFSAAWRRWRIGILEPYYLFLNQDESAALGRSVHTAGMHLYGPIADSRFDYDLNAALQWGREGSAGRRAHAWHAEVGYTFEHDWKPRAAMWFNYASGENPDDDRIQRFDSLFGSSSTFYSFAGLFNWQNMINPTVHVSLNPGRLGLNFLYRAYWLANSKDAFARARLHDPTGRSGSLAGQAFEFSAKRALNSYLTLDLRYSHFFPGSFVDNQGTAPQSDMVSVWLTFNP